METEQFSMHNHGETLMLICIYRQRCLLDFSSTAIRICPLHNVTTPEGKIHLKSKKSHKENVDN